MDIKSTTVNGFVVIELEGELDLYSAPQARATAGENIHNGMLRMIIDLTKVRYVDSSGLATLIEIRQRIRSNQGDVFLVGLNEKLKNLFEITKFNKLFEIYATQQEVFSQQ